MKLKLKLKEGVLYHGWIKLILGMWLIISGLISYLTSPINMMIAGFAASLCCFASYKLWQAVVTGSLGLWLFLCGLSYHFIHTHLVTPINFFIVGIMVSALGLHCIIFHHKKFISKPAL